MGVTYYYLSCYKLIGNPKTIPEISCQSHAGKSSAVSLSQNINMAIVSPKALGSEGMDYYMVKWVLLCMWQILLCYCVAVFV